MLVKAKVHRVFVVDKEGKAQRVISLCDAISLFLVQ